MTAAAKVRLTDKTVSALKPAEEGRRYCVWDALVPNFGVRVTGSGAASFVLLLDNRWTTLGRYPALGLGEARERAKIAMKRPPERAPTFAEVAADYTRRRMPSMRPSSQQ